MGARERVSKLKITPKLSGMNTFSLHSMVDASLCFNILGVFWH